jgi:hypothetical protein
MGGVARAIAGPTALSLAALRALGAATVGLSRLCRSNRGSVEPL